MIGVPRSIAEHRLNQEGMSSDKAKEKRYALERNKTIQEEVTKLVEAHIKREVHYQSWLSNPMMGKSMMAAGGWYHQIQMAEEDEEKTTFHTSQGAYCYTKMPFSLKNPGATYQQLVDKAFENQIGRNLEVYDDDLVIRSHKENEILKDIEETFRAPRKINMKLNPKNVPLERKNI
ncbi:hypothetical protein Tco_0719409 [Tanacetum coccineum]